jgi:hypothetical protein
MVGRTIVHGERRYYPFWFLSKASEQTTSTMTKRGAFHELSLYYFRWLEFILIALALIPFRWIRLYWPTFSGRGCFLRCILWYRSRTFAVHQNRSSFEAMWVALTLHYVAWWLPRCVMVSTMRDWMSHAIDVRGSTVMVFFSASYFKVASVT